MPRALPLLRLAAVLSLLSAPALAEDDFPQSPKIGPPEPLPEASCDTAQKDGGQWLLGRWVAPNAKFEFSRASENEPVSFSLNRKAGFDEFGWTSETIIKGMVDQLSPCSLRAHAGENGQFVFEAVSTAPGKIYGFATNAKGDHVRFILRRER